LVLGGPPKVIDFIGKYCEFRVHWFCKICDELALHAVQTYSHMSNPLVKEITSCFNDTVINQVAENVVKAVN